MKTGSSPVVLGVGAAFCVTLGALSALWFSGLRSRAPAPPPAATGEVSEPAAARPPRALPSPDTGGMRAEIQRATARALEEVKPAELERYLDSLEQRARAQNRVTALELEPGMALAEAMTGDLERAGRFARRMERLQRELSARAAGPTTPAGPAIAPAATVETLAGRIAGEGDNSRRQALLREYMEAAQALPEEEQAAAFHRLGQIPGALPPASAAASPDDLYRAIAAVEPGGRQGAIARYLEAVQGLPDEEERGRRLRDLERTYGAGATATAPRLDH